MGDTIKTTVAAHQPFMYYKVSGNGLWFDIKAQNKGLVGLLEECGRTQYWFEYSNPGVIKIIENSETRMHKSGQSFTLSADRYTRFWIAWNSNMMWAGIGYNLEKVISFPTTMNLNYVTFATTDSSYESHFRFEVPPLASRVRNVPIEPKLSRGKLKWKRCHDQLPDEAVIGGYIDGEIVYVIRAHHRRSLTPGVFIPSKGLAYIPWGQSDNPTGNFEALCGFNLEWKVGSDDNVPVDAFVGGYSEGNFVTWALCGVDLKWREATARKVPVDAFVAGYSEDNREPLYIGRARYEGNVIPGKVQLSHKTCYIAHQGREIAVKNFDVLVQPGLNEHCANQYIKHVRREAQIYNYYPQDEDDDDDDDDED